MSIDQAIEDFLEVSEHTSDPELRAIISALFIEELTAAVLTDEDIAHMPIDHSDELVRLVTRMQAP